MSDCNEKLGFLDVGGTLVIAGKETGRNSGRWGCLEGRKCEKKKAISSFGIDRETDCDVSITARDDLVEHGQDVVFRRAEIRRVGCRAHQVKMILNLIVNIEVGGTKKDIRESHTSVPQQLRSGWIGFQRPHCT